MESSRMERFWEMISAGFMEDGNLPQTMDAYLAEEYKRCGNHLPVLKGALIGMLYTVLSPFSTPFSSKEDEMNGMILAIQEAHSLTELKEPLVTIAERYYSSKNGDVTNGMVLLAMHRIETSYASKVLLKDIAQDLYVSPSYISRLIKNKYGKNFIDLLTETRINKAKTLLMDTRIPIRQVSTAVGFTEYIYFYKTFRKNMGVSPQQYRNSIGYKREGAASRSLSAAN